MILIGNVQKLEFDCVQTNIRRGYDPITVTKSCMRLTLFIEMTRNRILQYI